MALEQQLDPTLHVDFDAADDVLYLSVGAPVPGYADEAADGILLRRSESNVPVGITAFDFRVNWSARRRDFYALAADFLHIPTRLIERSIETAL